MRRVRILIIIIGVLGVLVLATLYIIGGFKPKVGGLLIESSPSSMVFINGQQVGRTPYEDKREPEEVTLKLIPDSFDTPLEPYETRVNVVAGVLTVVKRDFGEVEETSSGEIISFEPVSGSETSLVVVSIPDSAQLLIDGYQQAVTPYKLSDIDPGEHTLKLSANGYLDRLVSVKAHRGYKLTAVIQLASTGVVGGEEENGEGLDEEVEPEEEDVPQVIVLKTPNNFLNVRSEPVSGSVLAKVNDGDVFEILERDDTTDPDYTWYKIGYENTQEGEDSKVGWISGQYSEELESGDGDLNPSATPSPVVTGNLSPTAVEER